MKYLNLLASDFKNNYYLNIEDCPIARATKRQFNLEHILVGGFTTARHDGDYNTIDMFNMDYSHVDFEHDYNIANELNFNDVVVRELPINIL